MSRTDATTSDMTKKRSGGKRPQGRSPADIIFARVPPPLRSAFRAYLASQRPAPSHTSAVIVALEEFLQARGFWPPPEPKP